MIYPIQFTPIKFKVVLTPVEVYKWIFICFKLTFNELNNQLLAANYFLMLFVSMELHVD
jgi:hypothetical protein